MEIVKLTFSGHIEATDTTRRVIAGKILPFGEIGHTNIGDVIFEKGSVAMPNNRFKLLLEHDPKKPIGRAINVQEANNGIYAQFKIAETTAGNDALIEAADLRDGLSVGVKVNRSEERRGVTYVTSAELEEVSLVHTPAFASASVEQVLASDVEPEKQEEETPTEETQQTESEASVDNATPTNEVETEKVEASRSINTAVIYATPRSPINTPAEYLYHKVKATLDPSSDSALYVRAADDSTTNNAGLIPTPQLGTLFNGKSDSFRASIDAITTAALPAAGMSLEIPRIKTVPTVADTNEYGTPSETGMEVEFVTATVNAYKGQNTVSVELFDRSLPVFLDILVSQMADAYALATNNFVNGELITAATLDSTTVATYPTASELLGIVSRGAASVYSGSKRFARNMIVSSGQWANIMTLNDGGRPIYMAQQPQNAGGAVAASSLRGNVAGLDLYVDYANGGDGDGTILLVNPDCFVWYESPQLRLQTNVVSNGSIEIMYYGYGALANLANAGAFKNNKA